MDDWQLSWTSERSILVSTTKGATQLTPTSQLADWIHSQHSSNIRSVIPSATGVLIEFDIIKCSPNDPWEITTQIIESFVQRYPDPSFETSSRDILIPVCYEKQCAPDLDRVSCQLKCDPSTVIELHTSVQYRVDSMGFMPGFGYMSSTHESLHLTRMKVPRTRVPAGSVGIAEYMTAVYPHQSAGGWHLIGRTPLQLFDSFQASPALLRVGDRVRFEQITLDEFEKYTEAEATRGISWG